MTTLLTVAIPHYDNVTGLLKTLETISKQRCSSMEIIVADNATGRSFEKIERICKSLYPEITLLKNNKNIGYDANVELCVRSGRGKFVWLLGSGDIPQGDAVKQLLKIITAYPKATSVLLNVNTDPSTAAKKIKDLSTKSPLLEPTKNRLCLSQLYRSALSGNVVNRSAWLKAAREPLSFNNWCHAERALQMHCKSEVQPFSVDAEHVEVFVAREDQGWWNHNDLSFLQIVLQHREILFHYGRFEALKKHQLPPHCKPLNLTVLKAMLYSRSIPTPSTVKQKTEVAEVLLTNKIHLITYKIIQILPKALVQAFINSAKLLKRVA